MWIPNSDPVESSSSAQQNHKNVVCSSFHSSYFPDDTSVGFERVELLRRSGFSYLDINSTFKKEVAFRPKRRFQPRRVNRVKFILLSCQINIPIDVYELYHPTYLSTIKAR
jgi:hypothetical protein